MSEHTAKIKHERTAKIKTHFRENKKVYAGTAIGVVVGAVGVVATALTIYTRSNNGAQIIQKVTQVGFRNETTASIIQLVERSTPSKPVHLAGTNLYFSSISEAARETGHQLSMISKNINGLIPDVNGDVFELLEPAA
jgi:hypothetical protein